MDLHILRCFCWTISFMVMLCDGSRVSVKRRRNVETIAIGAYQDPTILNIAMPGVQVTQKDTYLCTAVPVERAGYIEKFTPKASADRVHHILLFGCRIPHATQGSWQCLHHANICANGQPVTMYAWARNAPPFELPDDVGVPVGPDVSGINYLVLQIHYSLAFTGDVIDYSGVQMQLSYDRPRYLAGIYLIGAAGAAIPGNSQWYPMNMTCTISGDTPVYAFAYRTHAHALGRVISAFRFRANQWTLIGKSTPQWPQMFYPIAEPVRLDPGERVAAQCIYENMNDEATYIGAQSNNEMCNFYVYYYAEAAKVPYLGQCSGYPATPTSLFQLYPAEGSSPMPENEALEEAAKQNPAPFGVAAEEDFTSNEVQLGQIGGLAFDQNGNLVVFHRGSHVWDGTTFDFYHHYQLRSNGPIDADAVVTFDANNGKVISKWGAKRFYLPHDVFVDHEGNFWLTDVAMHQVLKFPATGEDPLVAVGEEFVPGFDSGHFCMPAGVVATTDGAVYVADGYCNSRIVKLNSDGEYLAAWSAENGARNLPDGSPPLGKFDVVHSLTVDYSRELIYVADRENKRIQILSSNNGSFIDQIKIAVMGRVFAVEYNARTDTLFALNGPTPGIPLRVFAIHPHTRQLLYSFAPKVGQLISPHAMAVSSDQQQLYVGELGPNKIWKFSIKEPLRSKRSVRMVREDEMIASLHDESVSPLHYFLLPACLAVVASTVLFGMMTARCMKVKRAPFSSEPIWSWVNKPKKSNKRRPFLEQLNRRNGEIDALTETYQ